MVEKWMFYDILKARVLKNLGFALFYDILLVAFAGKIKGGMKRKEND